MFRFLTFLLLCVSVPAHAGLKELKSAEGLQTVGMYVDLLEDASNKLTIDDILKPETQALFKPSDRRVPNVGLTRSNIWVKVSFTTKEQQDWMLEIASPFMHRVDFYQPYRGEMLTGQARLSVDQQGLNLVGNHFLFPLKLAPGDTTTCYFLMADVMPITVFLIAGTQKDFFLCDHTSNFYHGLYIGIMFLMVLYNLFLYFTNRDRVYIYYVLYIIFSTLFVAFFLGYTLSLPAFMRYVFMRLPVLAPALFGVFGLLFTVRFLYTKKHAPLMHKVIMWFLAMIPIPMITNLIGYTQESIMIIQIMGLLLCLISFMAGVTVLYRGYHPAKFYVLGFGFYMTGLLIIIITGLSGGFDDSPWRYSLEVGSGIEAVMLSFAIGDKLNTANKDKQKAQAAALESAQENEKLVREQNIVLEQKVKERTAEIEHQKEVIEEKNKDITSSIQYAKRIQGALLASDAMLSKHLPEHFVFYKPKDIVSGDFYWASPEGGKLLLLGGDCTGHGVPGAFMSLLSTTFLNEITGERQINRPDQVLNALREGIIKALNPEGREEEGKDGLDGVLCSFDFANGRLDFACSNNPLWLIRENEVIEFKPDKFPVGMHEGEAKPFTLQSTAIRKGDIIYLFTDGFADQFGGPKGKKFKYKQLQELLLFNSSKTMKEQKELLDAALAVWKGSLEQVDDILIIGVRVV